MIGELEMKKAITILFVILLLSGCTKKETVVSRNTERIYQEEGFPVKVKKMELEPFVKTLSYHSILTGLRQSHASAMMGGRIDKVHVKIGDYVEKDSVIIEFPQDAPGGQYIQAKSAYDITKTTYARMKNLYEKGGISKQELDQLEAQLNVSKANYDAVQQMLKVRAPISGIVSNLTVNETDNVPFETVMATITQTDKMKTRIWASESEICQIEKGMLAEVRWNNQTFYGKVVQIAMAMDPTFNAFAVEIHFDNTRNLCKSGVIGEIYIETYSKKALIVERKVVKENPQGKYVFVAEQNKAIRKFIEIGNENGSFEVVSGLHTDDLVIVEGIDLLYDGALLNIAKE
jgi:RND family efflux transporter MFP subunit